MNNILNIAFRTTQLVIIITFQFIICQAVAREIRKVRSYLSIRIPTLWLLSPPIPLLFTSDAIVSQVLDELGLQMTEGLSDLPSTAGTLGATTPASKTPVAVTDAADDDIQARLDNLRREWGSRADQSPSLDPCQMTAALLFPSSHIHS